MTATNLPQQSTLPARLGRSESRHARGEGIEPCHKARMVVAPISAKAKIAIAERAGEPNLADIGQAAGHCIERWRIRLKHS